MPRWLFAQWCSFSSAAIWSVIFQSWIFRYPMVSLSVKTLCYNSLPIRPASKMHYKRDQTSAPTENVDISSPSIRHIRRSPTSRRACKARTALHFSHKSVLLGYYINRQSIKAVSPWHPRPSRNALGHMATELVSLTELIFVKQWLACFKASRLQL